MQREGEEKGKKTLDSNTPCTALKGVGRKAEHPSEQAEDLKSELLDLKEQPKGAIYYYKKRRFERLVARGYGHTE